MGDGREHIYTLHGVGVWLGCNIVVIADVEAETWSFLHFLHFSSSYVCAFDVHMKSESVQE